MYKIIACFFGTMLLYGSANAFLRIFGAKTRKRCTFCFDVWNGTWCNAPGVGDKTYASKNELLIEASKNRLCKEYHKS